MELGWFPACRRGPAALSAGTLPCRVSHRRHSGDDVEWRAWSPPFSAALALPAAVLALPAAVLALPAAVSALFLPSPRRSLRLPSLPCPPSSIESASDNADSVEQRAFARRSTLSTSRVTAHPVLWLWEPNEGAVHITHPSQRILAGHTSTHPPHFHHPTHIAFPPPHPSNSHNDAHTSIDKTPAQRCYPPPPLPHGHFNPQPHDLSMTHHATAAPAHCLAQLKGQGRGTAGEASSEQRGPEVTGGRARSHAAYPARSPNPSIHPRPLRAVLTAARNASRRAQRQPPRATPAAACIGYHHTHPRPPRAPPAAAQPQCASPTATRNASRRAHRLPPHASPTAAHIPASTAAAHVVCTPPTSLNYRRLWRRSTP
ncbi:hypothetical protein PLICRDRAFT_177301 [Plicaturopsis crispa FD-325 SS-3]|nr:hypothetical protein PLICRDRAFT_177301 [Plicaturopsis crispa FD-325 SS-3]